MRAKLSLTYSTVVVLQAIASGYRYGFDIMDATGLASGTVYPALRRLERLKLVRSAWEDDAAAQREERPPRRYYRMTGGGAEVLAEGLKRFHGVRRLFTAFPEKV